MPQNGRDDSHRKEVHKPIRLMGSGPKRVEVKPIVWKDLNGIEGEPEIKALDFFVKSKSFTNKRKLKNNEVSAHISFPKTVEVTKITVDKVSANEDSCPDKQLSKASASVIASEELAVKEPKIGINSVAAENTITSTPHPKDIVKEDEDNCQERQLSKASVISSEKKADRYVAECKAVNNSTNNCDEDLNNKPNDQIMIDSVAADKITSGWTEMADTVNQDIRSNVIDTQKVDKHSKAVENNQKIVSHIQNQPLKICDPTH